MDGYVTPKCKSIVLQCMQENLTFSPAIKSMNTFVKQIQAKLNITAFRAFMKGEIIIGLLNS